MSLNIAPDQHAVPGQSPWVLVDAPEHLRGVLDEVAVGPGGILAIARWTHHVIVHRGVVRAGSSDQGFGVNDVVLASVRLGELLHKPHRAVTAPLVVIPGNHPPMRVRPGAVVLGDEHLGDVLHGLDRHLGPDDVADVLRRLTAADQHADDLPTVDTLTAQFRAARERPGGSRRR